MSASPDAGPSRPAGAAERRTPLLDPGKANTIEEARAARENRTEFLAWLKESPDPAAEEYRRWVEVLAQTKKAKSKARTRARAAFKKRSQTGAPAGWRDDAGHGSEDLGPIMKALGTDAAYCHRCRATVKVWLENEGAKGEGHPTAFAGMVAYLEDPGGTYWQPGPAARSP